MADLTVRQVAERLNVDRTTITRWINAGHVCIPALSSTTQRFNDSTALPTVRTADTERPNLSGFPNLTGLLHHPNAAYAKTATRFSAP